MVIFGEVARDELCNVRRERAARAGRSDAAAADLLKAASYRRIRRGGKSAPATERRFVDRSRRKNDERSHDDVSVGPSVGRSDGSRNRELMPTAAYHEEGGGHILEIASFRDSSPTCQCRNVRCAVAPLTRWSRANWLTYVHCSFVFYLERISCGV